jgi:hypothetical protein
MGAFEIITDLKAIYLGQGQRGTRLQSYSSPPAWMRKTV